MIRMIFFFCLSFGLPQLVLAWSDHANLAWAIMHRQPALVEQTVPAEPLSHFLIDQTDAIAATLKSIESWSIENLSHYRPTPEALRWTASVEPSVEAFCSAIRINPLLPYRLYVKQMPEGNVGLGEPLNWSDLSFLAGGVSQQNALYFSLFDGEAVSIAEVLASASDEPDSGMDIGLFEDNGTEFGQRYGFGIQPFGNPNLEYSSQAPFHMGFYHLDWLTRRVRPDLLQTYPAWRVALFGELADLAFRTGHSYWGWRFLGWGLHYIGDLTQPYHVSPLPGVGTFASLWSVLRGKTGELIQIVSNRHGVIESYQYQRLRADLVSQDWITNNWNKSHEDYQVERWGYDQMIDYLTLQSVSVATEFDQAIASNMPPRFVNDPTFEWTGSGYEADIVQQVRAYGGELAIQHLDAAIILQLRRFSEVAKRWIKRGKLDPTKKTKIELINTELSG